MDTRSWNGQRDTNLAPSDSTGAIGPNSYIELVNSKYAIYNRTSNTPLSSGALINLTGSVNFGDDVFDPQIIWDPDTSRFYYASDNIGADGNNYLMFGFSNTATPTSPADFCKIKSEFNYGLPSPTTRSSGTRRTSA